MKRSHPALSFERAKLRRVRVAGQELQIWMAPDIDALLNDFIEVGNENSEWNDKRCPFGAVLWPSARALWEWLCEDTSRFESFASARTNENYRVLELGSGVGFFSALIASHTKWSITASDYEPAYADYLRENSKLLGGHEPQFETLDWCEPAPLHLRDRFDLVIGCDVFYDDTHLESLPRIASELLKPGGTLLLADPERFRFQSALDKITARFNHLNRYETVVANTEDEATHHGVVSPGSKQTKVQIIHCQKPLTSPT